MKPLTLQALLAIITAIPRVLARDQAFFTGFDSAGFVQPDCPAQPTCLHGNSPDVNVDIPCGCGECALLVDFSQFDRGDYVTQIIPGKLTVMATGSGIDAFTPEGAARIFDSSSPGPDLDLASPHRDCGGLGRGAAGAPGSDSENCLGLGNLLIIQHRDKTNPDSYEKGGALDFVVADGMDLKLAALGVINIPATDSVDICDRDNQCFKTQFQGVGMNGFQRVSVPKSTKYLNSFKITFPSEGALSWILFCEPHRISSNHLVRNRRLQDLESEDS